MKTPDVVPTGTGHPLITARVSCNRTQTSSQTQTSLLGVYMQSPLLNPPLPLPIIVQHICCTIILFGSTRNKAYNKNKDHCFGRALLAPLDKKRDNSMDGITRLIISVATPTPTFCPHAHARLLNEKHPPIIFCYLLDNQRPFKQEGGYQAPRR